MSSCQPLLLTGQGCELEKNFSLAKTVSFNEYYVPSMCWCYLGWQKKQDNPILAAMKIWSICMKLCRSMSQGLSAIQHLGIPEI
jgi:hypothetical protein